MSITYDGFVGACRALSDSWSEIDRPSEWEDVKILRADDKDWLRIVKLQPFHSLQSDDAQDEHPEESDDDSEALRRSCDQPTSRPRVVYDIVHSPSYQVPVLYITLRCSAVRSLDDVYELLVPRLHRSSLRTVGLLGGLTMAEHSLTGMSAYFVHPCLTKDALEMVATAPTLEPVAYLLVWIGLIGNSVGLNAPIELARRLSGVTQIREGDQSSA